ncbi:MAG: hypothetical protein HYX24_00495 [Candidatus Aenigmarchaeota archaeon]|nr:hypothetical protein [Candidatus Aenigmarchaeota archaeon]
MKAEIAFIIIGIAALSQTAFALETVYSVQINFFRNDTAALEHFEIAEGTPTEIPDEGTYSIKVMSGSKVLFQSRFQVRFQALCATGGESALKKGEKLSVDINSRIYSVELLEFGDTDAKFSVNGVNGTVGVGKAVLIAGLTIFLSKLDPAANAAVAILYEEPVEGEDPEGSCPVLEQVPKWYRLPFYRNADRIVVKHADKNLLTVDIPKYACKADGKCNGYENEILCPADCRPKQTAEQESSPKPTSSTISSGELPLLPIIGAVLALAVIIFVLYRKRARPQDIADQPFYQQALK